MISSAIQRLEYLLHLLPPLLATVPDEVLNDKPLESKWSKKEIIGHLIDSAVNNHQRFIRVQFEQDPCIYYDQDAWNKAGKYNTMESRNLLHFWEVYNRHFLELWRRIPPEQFLRTCVITGNRRVSLAWLINDYVRHLEHHLHQIVQYEG